MRNATCHPTRKHVAHGLCRNCYQAEWARTHPEYNSNDRKQNAQCHPHRKMVGDGLCQPCYMRRWWLSRKYGLSWARVEEMIREQKGRCPICGATVAFFGHGPVPNRGFAVDHDHRTGAVRGLLCHRCNNGLGCFDDDPASLASAIAYLEKHMNIKATA